MSKKLIIALGAALLLSAGPSLAQVPGLESLGNMLGGASNDAAAAAAGAAAPATDAATQAVDHVEKGKKAAGHARNAVKHGKALKGKEAAGEAGDAAKAATDAVQ